MIMILPNSVVARLPRIRDEWIGHGLSTEPADRKRAEEGVEAIYDVLRRKLPERFDWFGSPRTAIRQAEHVVRQCRSPTPYKVLDRIAEVWDQTNFYISNHTVASVFNLLSREVILPVNTHLQSINHILYERMIIDFMRGMYGQHDAARLAFFDALRDLLPDQARKFEGFLTVAKSAGWWVGFDKTAILTDRPTELHRDDRNLLHNLDGPALRYPDGFAIYAVHGVRVNRKIVEHPESITVRAIDEESNAEVRRVMIERYPWSW